MMLKLKKKKLLNGTGTAPRIVLFKNLTVSAKHPEPATVSALVGVVNLVDGDAADVDALTEEALCVRDLLPGDELVAGLVNLCLGEVADGPDDVVLFLEHHGASGAADEVGGEAALVEHPLRLVQLPVDVQPDVAAQQARPG